MADSSEPQVADLGMAKALANPVRQQILRELDLVDEATSTTLAQRLAMTTGATSYNLRVLAKYGLVEEVSELAHGRERWWRKVRVDVRLGPRGTQGEDLRAAVDRLNQLWLSQDVDLFARFQDRRSELGEWGDAVPYSRGSITVSLAELAAFFEEYLALLRKYQRDSADTPADARTVHTRFIAFPEPDEGG
nr:helix-turn-helix domain-containing protein [Kibdelosporangium sp. MJ126-NF4]CEL19912.1 Transcriptional regulator, ArsR family [Kibdelosporangium sp. MJ126-NF4]CTQ97136.1 Transcriptional regulator, ArsR family [Kibdelosporangium sp. MJ126-NF4]